MQRLELEENEKLTRKEYFKRKKKEFHKLKRVSKITYLMILIFVVLIAYVVFQITVYKKENNYSYLEDENVISQDVYNMYYITESYSYNPNYALNSIYSNGFNDVTILSDSGFTNIMLCSKYIFGIKDEKLFCYDIYKKELKECISENVENFTIYDNTLYLIIGEDSKLYSCDIEDFNLVDLNFDQVCEILVDENNIFVAKDEKKKKQLYKLDKDGGNATKICEDSNVSYIIADENKLYFVNKSDDNKIYTSNKDGSDYKKLSDIESVTDNGIMKNIDGSTYMYVYNGVLYYINSSDNYSLWKYDLQSGENVKEVSMPIDMLRNVKNTVFFKLKNSVGVYLYNTDTKFMSEISKRKIRNFIIDTNTKVFVDNKKTNHLRKN